MVASFRQVGFRLNCLAYVYISALCQFKWDYMSERRPIDLLLAVGGNDLINHGLTGLSHGLRGWTSEIENYSRSRGVSATIAVCTLPWCLLMLYIFVFIEYPLFQCPSSGEFVV